jgi:predicted naringenin-chalcone synthase
MKTSLVNFQVIRPVHSADQESILEWVAHAHSHAEALKNKWDLDGEEFNSFYEAIKGKLLQIGVGPDKIKRRGMQSSDFIHKSWKEMEIFKLEEAQEGLGLKARKDFFDKQLDGIFDTFYPEEIRPASHLIHVTCTGYAAPSGAQRLVSKKNLGRETTVTHAYHMGCYAAFPAIRMALGFLSTPHQGSKENSVDIVHTEMCSLHFNPILHSTEQLVVQTLFADGFIKYSLVPSDSARKSFENVLDVLSLHEEIIPDSSDSMTWGFENWGMRMTIAKEVPVLIKRNLPSFVQRLVRKAGLDPDVVGKEALYAIHPGGPKIVQQVAEILNLDRDHVRHSQGVLEEFGNMSSGTIPHVWERILKDPQIKKGTWIIGLAFGPGLSISGGLFQKG